jgi:hypothetical protein
MGYASATTASSKTFSPMRKNPNAATVRPVRIQARKVRAFAAWLVQFAINESLLVQGTMSPAQDMRSELSQDYIGRPIVMRCIPTAPTWRAALTRAAGAECRMKIHARTTVSFMACYLRRERR